MNTGTNELLAYLVFGLLTTLINYAVYVVCMAKLGLGYCPSNTIAWILSVLFAYITNKHYVFKVSTKGARKLFQELWQFFSARLFSLGLETALLWLCIDILACNAFVTKLGTNALVVLVNYAASKWIIFKKEKL